MADATTIDDALLAAWPLPAPEPDGDKESRGRVLLIAGSAEVPGAAVLAGEAALRAGAGKLAVATPRSVAPLVAAALPEARVVALDEDAHGVPRADSLARIDSLVERAAAVLVGPGMLHEAGVCALVEALLARLPRETALLLDASAMAVVRGGVHFEHRCAPLLTPHAGEMAHLCEGAPGLDAAADAAQCARAAARRWHAVVALKGAQTLIARPDGRLWCHTAEVPGLAVSGSGDVLAGLMAGLAARGAPLDQAAAWGVALHARAGLALAQRMGPLGTLARELAAEVPALMRGLTPP